MHGSSTSSKALVTSEEARDNAGGTIRKGQKLSKVLGLFSRKPKDAGPASPPPAPPTPPRPVRLNFLFVGSRGTGQTCLLLWETLNRPFHSLEDIPSNIWNIHLLLSRTAKGGRDG